MDLKGAIWKKRGHAYIKCRLFPVMGGFWNSTFNELLMVMD